MQGGDEAVGITGTVGLQGKGGIGKTMLAMALASDEAVRFILTGRRALDSGGGARLPRQGDSLAAAQTACEVLAGDNQG